MERKRLTAKLASAHEVVRGKFVQKTGFESNYVLTTLGRKISRVRIMGLVVDKYISEDNTYGAITLDDGSDTVRCKIFVSVKMLEGLNPGDLVDVTGKVREYNGEIYIMPEIIRRAGPNQETLRMLELKKIKERQTDIVREIRKMQNSAADMAELKVLANNAGIQSDTVEALVEAQDVVEVETEVRSEKSNESKSKILKIIEELDQGEGVEYNVILSKSGLEEAEVDASIQELLETGVCFEPRAGKLKKI